MEEFLKYSGEFSYRSVLILDKTNSIRGQKLPKLSMEPLQMADLCFYQLDSGGMECIKDRYDSYGKGSIWFGA